MTLSLLAFVGSLFLFVFATFAWFYVSQWVHLDTIDIDVGDMDISATLEVSSDGITYESVDAIEFDYAVPGETKYYHLIIENTGSISVRLAASLFGFTDGPANDELEYDETKSLLDVTMMAVSNDVSSESISDEYMVDLLDPYVDYSSQPLYLATGMVLAPTEIGTISFSFLISGTDAGNDYQNLKLTIARIVVNASSG
jgi:hypothetical protein